MIVETVSNYFFPRYLFCINSSPFRKASLQQFSTTPIFCVLPTGQILCRHWRIECEGHRHGPALTESKQQPSWDPLSKSRALVGSLSPGSLISEGGEKTFLKTSLKKSQCPCCVGCSGHLVLVLILTISSINLSSSDTRWDPWGWS